MKYYVCPTCGNIISYARQTAVPVMCCGKPMVEMVPGSTDAATEKHVPVVTVEGNKVTVRVGSVDHPMTEEHYIPWITLVTNRGEYRRVLKPTDAPVVEFLLGEGEEYETCLAWCNLHGLWKAN